MMAGEAGEVKGRGAEQGVKETHAPLTATSKHPERVDYEYERAHTAAVFLGRPHGPYVPSR